MLKKLFHLIAVYAATGFTCAAVSAQTPQGYFTMVPCRLLDTRNPAGPFGGPTISGFTTRTFPIGGQCGLPSSATAYVLTVTAIPQQPLVWMTVWPTGESQPNISTLTSPTGAMIANAAIVDAGTNGSINVFASNTTDVVIDITGYFGPPTSAASAAVGTSTAVGTGASTAGSANTAIGFNALTVNGGSSNTGVGSSALAGNSNGNNNVAVGSNTMLVNSAGSANTAIGTQALTNDFASDNTALGFSALFTNTLGLNNTAAGVAALYNNTSAQNNTAVGMDSLFSDTTGGSNTSVGFQALYSNASGQENVAMGVSALRGSTGSSNIAIGYSAGSLLTTGNSNIYIGSQGMSSDSAVIRIGTPGTQTTAYLAGVSGVNVSGADVVINANGQLGITASSERFKENIQSIGQRSDKLMDLRPVTFRYKQPEADGAKPLQYGLIGEEVANVYPELVLYDRNGQVESLKYYQLPVLLLNELQKEHKTIEELEARIAALEAALKQSSHQ